MEYGDITIQDQADILPFNVAGTASYDLSTTGSLVVTGIGFKPRNLILFNVKSSTGAWGMYCIDENDEPGVQSQHEETADFMVNSSQVTFVTATSTEAYLNLASFDTDGFTFTKTKFGSPTGTGHIKFLAFK